MKESLSIMLSMIALNVAKSSLSNKGIFIELNADDQLQSER